MQGGDGDPCNATSAAGVRSRGLRAYKPQLGQSGRRYDEPGLRKGEGYGILQQLWNSISRERTVLREVRRRPDGKGGRCGCSGSSARCAAAGPGVPTGANTISSARTGADCSHAAARSREGTRAGVAPGDRRLDRWRLLLLRPLLPTETSTGPDSTGPATDRPAAGTDAGEPAGTNADRPAGADADGPAGPDADGPAGTNADGPAGADADGSAGPDADRPAGAAGPARTAGSTRAAGPGGSGSKRSFGASAEVGL